MTDRLDRADALFHEWLDRSMEAYARQVEARKAIRADLESRRWYGKLRRHAERLDQGGDEYRRRAVQRMGTGARRGVVGGPTVSSATRVPESPPEKSEVGY